ncbi:MAG: alpha/beta fold hydrolase [Nocardioides sp.]|nr:alpha/beta fold hydrolase [Nocardioides sp.]
MRRLVVAVVLVVVVVLIAGAGILVARDTGSGDAGPTPVTPTGGAPATTPPSPALARFYDQHLDWSACNDGDQCARLTVPLDYQDPGGRTITLAVLKVPASGSRIGSLVVNPGGPGAPGTSFAASRRFGDPLLAHFDIVGFDPRGTGDSSPVDCLSDAALNRYLASDPNPRTPAEKATFRHWQHRLATGCSHRSGDLAAHVSTVDSARDMDVLRAALGERTLTYLGSSYGTELGATYAQLFPHRVGRFVLDGAVDPTLGLRALSLQQTAGFQKALDAYLSNCLLSAEGCFLGRTVPGAEQTISALLDRLTRHPIPAGNGRELAVGDAYYGIVAALYDRDTWIVLSAGLRSALQGDGSVLMALADAYADRNTDGTFRSNMLEAFFTISCLDNPASVPFSRIPSEIPAFEKASPVFGRANAWSLTSCRGFTPRSDEQVPVIHAKGASPIVVIGTTRDPATPFRWAVDLARQLDSGVLVSRDGDGHTAYATGNPCIDHVVESYLVSGTVPANGTSC